MTGLFGQNPLQPDGENLAEFAKRCCHVNWATVACLTVWA